MPGNRISVKPNFEKSWIREGSVSYTHLDVYKRQVLDYTDAVMLSAESASGAYPVETVQARARVGRGAEKHPTSTQSHHRLGETFTRCDETIALAAMYAANHFPGVKAIIRWV